jgi:hypothetical protein
VKPGDAARVLASCMMFDGRQMPEDPDMAKDMALAWYSVIGDLELVDALEAVRRHYMASRKWAMPADIREGVAALKKERSQALEQPNELRALPSRFEQDVDRHVRAKRGADSARSALHSVFEVMALKNGSPAAMNALEELRRITAQQKQPGTEDEGGTRK